jgi:hypothetical protein
MSDRNTQETEKSLSDELEDVSQKITLVADRLDELEKNLKEHVAYSNATRTRLIDEVETNFVAVQTKISSILSAQTMVLVIAVIGVMFFSMAAKSIYDLIISSMQYVRPAFGH